MAITQDVVTLGAAVVATLCILKGLESLIRYILNWARERNGNGHKLTAGSLSPEYWKAEQRQSIRDVMDPYMQRQTEILTSINTAIEKFVAVHGEESKRRDDGQALMLRLMLDMQSRQQQRES